MSDETEIKVRRMLQALEHQIVEINKRNIREIAGEIDAAQFLRFAEAIAVSRAQYLKAALAMVVERDGETRIEVGGDLVDKRRDYHEALRGFNALRHALTRGYFILGEDS